MHRRLVTGIVVLGVAAVACARQLPPERTTLPKIVDVVEPPQPCSFLVGEGLGVEVDQVVSGSPAEGHLHVGDRIVAIDQTPLVTVADLFDVMTEKEPAETVVIALVRDGAQVEVPLTLAPNPDDGTKAIIGVLVTTAYERVLPEAVGDDPAVRGRLVRVVDLEGRLYALDPLSGRWSALGLDTPEVSYETVGDGVFVLDDAGSEDASLRRLDDPDPVVLQTGGWTPVGLLGTVGDLLTMTATRPIAGTEDRVEIGVLAADPETGRVRWEWPVPSDVGGVPRFGVTSPERQRLLVATSASDDRESIRYLVLQEDGDLRADQTDLQMVAGKTVFGWFSNRTLLFQDSDSRLRTFDLLGFGLEEVELPESIAVDDSTRLWPVGDGRNVLVANRRSFVRADLIEGGEIRVLAERCRVQTDNAGFGA